MTTSTLSVKPWAWAARGRGRLTPASHVVLQFRVFRVIDSLRLPFLVRLQPRAPLLRLLLLAFLFFSLRVLGHRIRLSRFRRRVVSSSSGSRRSSFLLLCFPLGVQLVGVGGVSTGRGAGLLLRLLFLDLPLGCVASHRCA